MSKDRSPGWIRDKGKDPYNWVPAKNKDFDSHIEPEDDSSQIEAVMVDCGVTKFKSCNY